MTALTQETVTPTIHAPDLSPSNHLDWSTSIAKALFAGSSSFKIRGIKELEDLTEQARANKAWARILPFTESSDDSVNQRLVEARREQEMRMREGLRLLQATQRICLDLGVPYAVIKSLDALPDLGHDIDLLLADNLGKVRTELLRRFQCYPVTLTFCDRQAGKFSTFIEGYNFDFELYAKISQMGEAYYPEENVLQNRVRTSLIDGATYLCSKEDRVLITCIHTMYRHGKIRLSDLNIVFQAFKEGIDVRGVLDTVESAGIQKGFAVFMKILEQTCQTSLGRNILPREVEAYVARVLDSDTVIAELSRDLKHTFPLKIPLGLSILLFLYKAAADGTNRRVRSVLRSLAATVVLLIDKSVPLRVQKAMSVRIW